MLRKIELKNHLRAFGIRIINGNYILKRDVTKLILADSTQVTYKDLFQSYAREDKRRVNKRLIAVMKTPLVGSGPTRLLFVMHADCGMTQLNTKMPSDYEWDAIPVDSLNPEHKSLAIHEKCALGSECLHYDHEKNRIISNFMMTRIGHPIEKTQILSRQHSTIRSVEKKDVKYYWYLIIPK